MMEFLEGKKVHYEPVDPGHFTGTATLGRIADSGRLEDVRIFRVCFEPGGRTDWHLHTGVQILYVEQGRGKVQKEGEDALEIGPGDTVYIRPGEKHWHGARAESPMIHLAINIAGRTEWMEKVSEEEYSAG